MSGLLALSLFIFFLVLFLAISGLSNRVKTFAMHKENYISISINTSKPQIKNVENSVEKSAQKSVEEKVENTNKEVPKNSPQIKKEEINVNNLFSDVKVKNIKKIEEKKKEIEPKRLQEIQKKINQSSESRVESISEKFQKLETNKKESQNTKTSSANEVNEYLAKIQALVYQYFYPPKNSQGKSIKAVIQLNSIGKVLDFRILSYSPNSELNAESDRIKNRLINIVFPENPDGKSGTYTVILISE